MPKARWGIGQKSGGLPRRARGAGTALSKNDSDRRVVFEPQLKEVAVIGRKIYVRGGVEGEKAGDNAGGAGDNDTCMAAQVDT